MEQFYEVPVDPEIRQTVRRAAEALAQLKIPAEPFEPQGLERAPNLWWFFFGQLPAAMTRVTIQGRESEAHWTSTEFLNSAADEAAPTVEKLLLNLAKRDRMRASLLRQMEKYPGAANAAVRCHSVCTPQPPLAGGRRGDRPVSSHDARDAFQPAGPACHRDSVRHVLRRHADRRAACRPAL